jgi:hypothetical protein
MKIVKDGFQVRKIPKEELDGAIAPIYLLGLPGDLNKLEIKMKIFVADEDTMVFT